MSFASDYLTLVSVSGSAKVNKLLRAGQFYNNNFQAVSFALEYVSNGKLIFTIPLDPPTPPSAIFFADLQVHFIEKSKLYENASPGEPFAVFFIVRPQKHLDIKGIKCSIEQDFKHELLHHDDLIEIFDTDSDFLSRGYNFSFNSLRVARKRDLNSIVKCVDYEVDKIFRLEPKALSIDYKEAGGEIYLPIPGESQVIVQGFETSKEYIQAKIVFQIIFLQSDLVSFAKDNDAAAVIESAIFEAVNKYGKDVFGNSAVKNFKALAGIYSIILYKDRHKNILNMEARIFNSKYTPDYELLWEPLV
ncbi:MAG: hypothetical protein GX267_08585 [Fibrobacter sp.]|nr:hypothetical protein [Fibrobacter sp.]